EIILNTLKDFERSDELQYDDKKFTIEKYKNKYLGEFIEDNITGLKRKYKANSGTLKNKVNFCNKAINYINNFDDLSEEAQNLTKRIFEFIKLNNS
ncbi:MAG: hypothetical protein H7Y00_02760, partial [Fimbriimonadaceae bacterium]|nr:hypothetical protein [Chitinophagales bacterium]